MTMLTSTQEYQYLKGILEPIWQEMKKMDACAAQGHQPPSRLTGKNILPMENDTINHPSHYIEGRKYEPISVIEDWQLPYHLGNAVKYISRAGRKDKDKMKEDLQKAVWYLERYIASIN